MPSTATGLVPKFYYVRNCVSMAFTGTGPAVLKVVTDAAFSGKPHRPNNVRLSSPHPLLKRHVLQEMHEQKLYHIRVS